MDGILGNCPCRQGRHGVLSLIAAQKHRLIQA
jgi:hypothetical protein